MGEGQAVALHAPRRRSDLDEESGFDGAEAGEGQEMDIDDESDLDGAEAGERQRIAELLRFEAQAEAERVAQEEADAELFGEHNAAVVAGLFDGASPRGE